MRRRRQVGHRASSVTSPWRSTVRRANRSKRTTPSSRNAIRSASSSSHSTRARRHDDRAPGLAPPRASCSSMPADTGSSPAVRVPSRIGRSERKGTPRGVDPLPHPGRTGDAEPLVERWPEVEELDQFIVAHDAALRTSLTSDVTSRPERFSEHRTVSVACSRSARMTRVAVEQSSIEPDFTTVRPQRPGRCGSRCRLAER